MQGGIVMSSKSQNSQTSDLKNSTSNVTMQQPKQENLSQSNAGPSSSGKKNAKVTADMSQPQNGNIDQVREILFGSQLRAQEESLAQLESRLELEQQKLNQTFNDRLDYIEDFFKEEMNSLKQLITGEIESRSVMEKRVDNAIDQQRLAAEADLKAVNDSLSQANANMNKALSEQITAVDTQLSKTISDATESIEGKLEQNESARTKSQNALQKELLTKLDTAESLFSNNLSEQKTFFNDALTLAINESNSARETMQAALLKDMTERSESLETQLSKHYKELDSKLKTAIIEQDTKQMDKENLAQHFLDIATSIKNS